VKPHHLIIALLIVVSMIIAPCAMLAGVRSPGWDGGLETMLAVGLAQIALLAAWAAWGRRWAVLRFAALTAGIVAWALPLAHWTGSHEPAPDEWMFALMCYAGLILLVLAAVRLCGWTIRIGTTEQGPACSSRRHQFSLWDLFSLVTSAALVAGFMTWAEVPWRSLLEMAVFVALLAAPVIVCLITGFAYRRTSRLLLCVIPALVSAMMLSGISQGGRNYLLVIALLCGFTLLATQALRSGGIRLGKAVPPAPRQQNVEQRRETDFSDQLAAEKSRAELPVR
jgi:hypothetical protein